MTEEVSPDDSKFFEELKLENYTEYEEIFKIFAEYKAGKANIDQVHEKLFELRFRQLKKDDLKKILDETDLTPNGYVSVFNCIILLKKLIDAGTKEKLQRIEKRKGNGLFRMLDPNNYKRKARPYSDREKNKYAKLINKVLKDDQDCKSKIPIDATNDELFDKLKDGIILGKLLRLIKPDAVPDLKVGDNLNPYDKFDNVKKAVDAAKDLGCNTETTADDVADGDKGRDEDLLNEIFKLLDVPKDKIKDDPDADKLVKNKESKDDLCKLPTDDFLKRWFNNHLKNAGQPEVNNFGDDLKDCKPYIYVLNDLQPDTNDKKAADDPDLKNRANKAIEYGKNLGVESDITADDLMAGEEPLNTLYVADLYKAYMDGLNANNKEADDNVMRAYVKKMNQLLANDADCKDKVPINPEGDEVFDKVKDGVVLAKLENLADGDAVDENDLAKDPNMSEEDKSKNLDKVCDGAKKLGLKAKTKPGDIAAARKGKVEDLIGDILDKINVNKEVIKDDPEADKLLQGGETKDDLGNLPPEDFLKRWFNHRLKNAGHPNQVTNFTNELKDGEKYTILLNDLFPDDCDKSPMNESDPVKRAAKIIDNAKNVGVDTVVTPEQLASGNEKLNRLFTGEVYNAYANPYNVNERKAYCKLMNQIFANDPDTKDVIPLDPETTEVYDKVKDGKILAKLVNLIAPATIDDRVLVTDKPTRDDKLANLNLALNAAKSVGVICDTTAEDVLNGKRQPINDLLYNLLKPIALKKVKIQDFPQLLRLKQDKEEVEDLLTLGPEDLLIRWFNHHLKNAGHPELANLGDDVKDSARYTKLLNQLDKDKCDLSCIDEPDLKKRGEKTLDNGKKIGANVYILPEDIPSGNERLNTLFTAELYNANIGLSEATKEEKMQASKLLDDDAEGAREERAFKMWINSLKLEDTRKVHNLYEECRSAILLLKIIDKIKPGTVNWKVVELHTKNPFKLQVNCNEAINACKKSNYSIVGIGGQDIREGNKKYILAIVWQLMRAHTLKVIGSKPEEELIEWANGRVPAEYQIKSLKEKKLNDALFWIELIASIEPKVIRRDLVVKDNPSEKDREMNAKYALSVARGLGACIFIVWEDITEVKSRLLLTFLASLYDLAQTKEKK